MRILYIGTPQLHGRFLEKGIPSHWLYGAEELAMEGNDVVWEWEGKSLLHDVKLLRKHRPDAVFVPNLNLRCHIVMLLLNTLHIINVPVFAFLHRQPDIRNGNHIGVKGIAKRIFTRLAFKGCRHLFFLSELTMSNTIAMKVVGKEKCSVPGWGPDTDFYSKIPTRDGGYFVSTGKENRDFDTLIEAFRITGAPLKIYCSRYHAGRVYTDLPKKCEGIGNIEVTMTDNSHDVFPLMLEAMANAKALVCPLIREKMTYCVGLSTVSDAEGLRKPLIITRNPYHDKERMKRFHQVETVDEWVKAIRAIMQEEHAGTAATGNDIRRCAEAMSDIIKANINNK